MSILVEISENMQKGKAKIVKGLVQEALDQGIPAQEILQDGLMRGMDAIGVKFKADEIYVPDVLVAVRAMNMGLAILKPALQDSGAEPIGKVCLGTVKDDLHDIGKNLVRMMLEGKGFEVIDLGIDVPSEKFIETAINENCQLICCSALLTTTMPALQQTVAALNAASWRGDVKVMVGGAPITQEFADKIGADAYTPDAASAAKKAKELVA